MRWTTEGRGRSRSGRGRPCPRPLFCLVLAVLPALPAATPIALLAAPHSPSDRADTGRRLAEMSLEELMQVEVTLVSRSPEPMFHAPAAIFVLTQEDIRRSGVASLPEVLRLVPGVHVARMDANTWAISSRGFNGQYSRKLLVLVDGRSVYSPLFTGVYWDAQDLPLEDVERIEVVRGPGGTLWGASAVNGIINIITKSAWATEGGLLSLNGGVEERGVATVRYGDRVGERMAYRVYGRAGDHGGFAAGGADAWELAQGGFRFDWQLEGGSFTLLGGAQDGTSGEIRRETAPDGLRQQARDSVTLFDGGHLLARFKRALGGGGNLRLQVYADHQRRAEESRLGLPHGFLEEIDTLDADLQIHLPPAGRHHLTLGAGYRRVDDRLGGASNGIFEPAARTYDLWSGFFEDRVSLVDERLEMVLGARLEHNAYTGFELQPAMRFLFTPRERQSLWLAVSRAVRTPSRVESDVLWDLAPPPEAGSFGGVLRLRGNPDLEVEKLTAFELGYRMQPHDGLVLDLALFHHEYDELVESDVGPPFLETIGGQRRIVVPLDLVNGPGATTHGAELGVRWQPTPSWELDLAYTLVLEDFTPIDATESPPQQVALRSLLDLSREVELDVAAFWVDRLPELGIDSYLRLDVRLGWWPHESLETAVGVRNLGGGAHGEFAGGLSGSLAVDIEPQVYARVTMRW